MNQSLYSVIGQVLLQPVAVGCADDEEMKNVM